MANWSGTARTNYFRVKDVEEFKKAFEKIDVVIIESDGLGIGLLGDDEYGGFPSGHYDEDDEYVDLDLANLVAEHLLDGEVAVFMEAGAEKRRYISGQAWAVNSKGEERRVNLEDIYELAKELGPNVTRAVY